MSATLGYGVELEGSILGINLEEAAGDFEEVISERFPELELVYSSPEYSTEKTQYFVFLKKTIIQAGGIYLATAVVPNLEKIQLDDLEQIQDFQKAVEVYSDKAKGPNWYLVTRFDY